ncbi:MAG: hypothetical protein HKN85_05085 [Gammaproteobacteria bacterium]|nr:hypothetical protein [Gammaproteobacteria bacterium]
MNRKQISRPLISISISLVTLLLIVGCVNNLKYTAPLNTDLSGVWLIDQAASEDVIIFPPRQKTNSARNGNDDSGPPANRSGKNAVQRAGTPPQSRANRPSRFDKPPVMTATQMTIEQDDLSMGIAYPGKVYRDVDWGKTDRLGVQVTAGWANNSLIIHVDDGIMDYLETYSLDPSGKLLRIELQVNGKGGKQKYTRVFTRKSGV